NNPSPTGPDYIVELGSAILSAPPGDISGVPLTYYRVPSTGTVFHRIILGSDGNMYFTELGLDKVGRLLTTTANATAATTVSLTPSATSLAAGQVLTLGAAVRAGSGGTPLGTVTFVDGSTALATVNLDSSGQASSGPLTLAAGTHSLAAIYSPLGGFGGSTSA